jgi:hypothetical protein
MVFLFTVVKQQAFKISSMPARSDNFQKFVKQKKGSAIKEEIKQQKRKEKKEKAAAIEAHFERKRAERQQRQQPAATPPPTRTGRPNKYPKKEVEVTANNGKATAGPTPKSTDRHSASPQRPEKGAPTKSSTPNKYSKKEVEVTAGRSAPTAEP